MDVPLVDLKKEYGFFKKGITRHLKDCFDSQAWILGPKVAEFEEKSAAYLGVKYAVGVASGTDALLLALRAIAFTKKGKERFDRTDEIITTPFTFAATAETILRAGATPVFVDIDPDTFNIAPEKIKPAINENTVGILPVHLYGQPADMEPIGKIAQDNGLFIVEDTAQAFGAIYKGKKAGSFGQAGAFSFFPTKNLGCFGDGGLVATNDAKVAEHVKILRNHGQTAVYNAAYSGYNSRLDSIQAAVLLAKLLKIDKLNGLRIKAAKNYTKGLVKVNGIKTPVEIPGAKHVYQVYTLKVSRNRDSLVKYLNEKGIHARVYYPVGIHQMPAFKAGKISGPLANAEAALAQVVSLPIYPFLKPAQIKFVIEAAARFMNKSF